MKNEFLHITTVALGSIRKYWRIILLMYGVEFLLSGLLAWLAVKWIEISIGHSASLSDLLNGWDQIIISDLFTHHGVGAQIWFQAFIVTSFAVFLLKYAWNAGMFTVFRNSNPSIRNFLGGLYGYFWIVLFSAIPFVLLCLLVIGGKIALLGNLFGTTPWENEHIFWQSIFGIALGGTLLIIGIRSYSIFAQDRSITNANHSFWIRLRKSISLRFASFLWIWLLQIILVLILSIAFYYIAKLELWLGVDNTIKVIGFFLLYQCVQIMIHGATLFIRYTVYLLNKHHNNS